MSGKRGPTAHSQDLLSANSTFHTRSRHSVTPAPHDGHVHSRHPATPAAGARLPHPSRHLPPRPRTAASRRPRTAAPAPLRLAPTAHVSRKGALIVFHSPSNQAADWLTKAASRGPASRSNAKSVASVPSASKVSTCAAP